MTMITEMVQNNIANCKKELEIGQASYNELISLVNRTQKSAAILLDTMEKRKINLEVLEVALKNLQEEDKYFDLSLLKSSNNPRIPYYGGESGLNNGFIQIRGCGEYKNKGFYLDKSLDWNIVNDKNNGLVLVPTRRKL